MTAESPFASFHALQDEAIRGIPPFPAERFSGRGIVMVAGGPRYFTNAWVTLHVLRRVVNCTLPVQLWYLGPREMSPKMIDLLRRLDVTCVDATRIQQQYPVRRLGALECKPYAMIHSPFREVLYLDADNTPLVNPSFLFSDKEYLRTGSILWPDLTRMPPDHPIWQICRVPSLGEPDVESGQVLVDKGRCWNVLHLTMHMNEWSEYYYQYIYGDKETFHLAWRMLSQPYGTPNRLPRKAVSWWSRAPLTDEGVWTLFQHDFAGREVFHHRTSTGKWNLFGENLKFEGFAFDAFCERALEDLRSKWDGWVTPPTPPARPPADPHDVTTSLYRYVRRGVDDRTMQLLSDRRIGMGVAEAEQFWRMEHGPSGPELIIAGQFGDICRLRAAANGVWHGRWLQFEQMPIELIPLG